jgi:hypothetical protein
MGKGAAWKANLPAVLRENSPYGMIGEVVETSASFEARYAPPPYPTTGMKQRMKEPYE